MIRRAIRRLVDLVVFTVWDDARMPRPLGVALALRLDDSHVLGFFACPICRDGFRAGYYRHALATATPRQWRYLEARRPDIVFLWRFGAPAHPATERA